MKLELEVYLNDLKKEINREIQVNDSMSLQKFCEYIIISMNGNCKHLYQLVRNEEYSYLGPGCNIIDSDTEEMMDDLTLSDICLKKGDELMVNYDFRTDWEIIIKVKNITDGHFEKEFEVISGCGVGILEDFVWAPDFSYLITAKHNDRKIEYLSRHIKGFKEYINKDFNILYINEEIEENYKKYLDMNKPKNYIMNVLLEGYNKEIKRKIAVDSNVSLDKFCRCIITSMKGDLSHSYGIKINKEYLDEEIIEDQDLNYLELKEKQRLKVVYDYGDNWIFNITVSKIIDDYGNKRFEVLSGKGYGIVDDCGGIWGLNNIFNKTNTDWGKYDINDFDLEDINYEIDIEF